MDSTVVVAAMGFVATLVGAWISAHLQRRLDRDGRILEARLHVYGDCSDSLFEYSRATYNRVKSRLQGRPESERDALRQEAYRCNARARSAIGQAYILSGDPGLEQSLSEVRHGVGEFNKAVDDTDLRRRQTEIYARLKKALEMARLNLAP